MDKNTLIGIVLMGLLLFGFTFYQNKQYQKQAAYQAQLDSIAAVEQFRADSIAAVEAAALRQATSQDSTLLADGSVSVLSQQAVYKDSLLFLCNIPMRHSPLFWPSGMLTKNTPGNAKIFLQSAQGCGIIFS